MNVTEIMDYKALIGIFGTSLSLALEHISVVVSILVGLATLVYMIEKYLQLRQNRK